MTDPDTNPSVRDVQYKGAPLDAERGPGLGCFWSQVVVLAVLVVLTPLSVVWRWPDWLSAVLLAAVILLLLVAGQTIIFLLRLVAADRRAAGRRRPLASATKTVGELEDEQAAARGGRDDAGSEPVPEPAPRPASGPLPEPAPRPAAEPVPEPSPRPAPGSAEPPGATGPVRQ